MFLGQYQPAIETADEMNTTLPDELLNVESPPMADWLEGFISMKQHVYIRFGKWQEIIDHTLTERSKPVLCHHRNDALLESRGPCSQR